MAVAPKIFVTGVTGYVGGDAVYALLKKYPAWESSTSVLIRNIERGNLVQQAWPGVRLVVGGLDDVELLVSEALRADIILNFADSDHPPSASALTRGAQLHPRNRPVFIVHTSGTGILTWKTVQSRTFGELEDKVYDDWDGIEEVTSLPDNAAHRNVDKIFLEAGGDDSGSVHTAIVCPPTIYGVGRGPVNTRSQQLYDLTALTLKLGIGKRVGKGENRQTHIHVHDLSELYVLLIEAATQGGGKATWGRQGYYFTSRGNEQAWGEIAASIAKVAHELGYIASDTVSEFSAEEANQSAGHAPASLVFGGNAREKSIRARKLLGWVPNRGSLFDEIPEAVVSEASRLGLGRNISH
ncbi:hypothetical protein GGI35DRAFT_463314 [Trichoderma velutinum]